MKLILQTQEKYKTISKAFIGVLKEEGILSFWRGNLTNILRYIPTQSINFSLNDLFKVYFIKDEKYSKIEYFLRSSFCGGLAAASGMPIIYPLGKISHNH
jgi:solute carrier family 25 (mitochondrial adenine nucleotide translocator), member 4/5/6/31